MSPHKRLFAVHPMLFVVSLLSLFALFLIGMQWQQPAQAQSVVSPSLQCLSFSFTLSGAEEVPPNGSPATGNGVVTIDTDTNQLSYNITFSGLQGAETAAHIHGFAAPGSNAGVLYTLPTGNPKIGTITYTEAQEANFLAGLSYVNIHSTSFSGGEIRGQIDGSVPCATPTPTITPTPIPTVTPTPPPCNPTAVNVTYNPLAIAYSTGETGKFFRAFLYNPETSQSTTLFQTLLPACFDNTINSSFNVPPGLYGCAFLYDLTTQELTLDCNPN